MNLTKEQIEKMGAGKKIDSLVAEKVMGINVVPHGESYEADQMVCNGVKCSVPPYSVNIATAWEIVEKLKPLKFKMNIDWDDNVTTEAEFFDEYDWDGVVRLRGNMAPTGYANKLPLAICRAALLTTL